MSFSYIDDETRVDYFVNVPEKVGCHLNRSVTQDRKLFISRVMERLIN